MLGFIFCALAGAAMSVQGVMNTRLGEGIGTMEANTLVQCTAAVLSVLALFVHRTGSFSQLGSVPWYYMLGGVLGPRHHGYRHARHRRALAHRGDKRNPHQPAGRRRAHRRPGLMGAERVALDWQKGLGLALMVGGVLLFKR